MLSFYEYAVLFTETYKANKMSPPPIREAECIKVMSRYQFLPIKENDLFAGRKRVVEIGFSNEPLLGRSVGFFYDTQRAYEAADREGFTKEQREELNRILDFWKGEETRHQIREAYPEYMKQAIPEDIYWEHFGVAFPLYRVVGTYMDYDKLLQLGINGLKEEVVSYKDKNPDNALYKGMEAALDVLTEVCSAYAEEAERAGKKEMASVLNKISCSVPDTFIEAVQLSWLYSLISGVLNYGRMDDYLGGFLMRDYERGILSKEEALDYVKSLWRLIAERNTVFHGRVVIGGKKRKDVRAADEFAMLAIEATRTVVEAEPQLSLRFYEGQNPLLMEKALDSIGEGRTYPILYNDDVNIPAVMKAFELPYDEASDYVMFGCGEYVINKKSIGSPNGIINLLKVLEITLFNGYDMLNGQSMGLRTGRFNSFKSFDEFYDAYKRQLVYYIEILAQQEMLEYEMAAKAGSFLYMSMLFDDCIERGLGLLEGGARYLGGTLETYGNINASNSLYAIKTLVFEQGLIKKDVLLRALKADFAGFSKERELLREVPKYGNDHEDIDFFASKFHNFLCDTVKRQRERTALHSYLVVIINNEANTILGRFTGASADGRKALEPMANANNPAGGTDKSGVTSMLNSLTRLDTGRHAGAVQNMTFSKELFNERRDILNSLLETYFSNGGQQAMITVLNKGDLENAMKYPERYGHIMVRVGGFSARFVTLAPDVQREIISRTVY